ncbi:MAG: hypothetical protein VX246_07630 [Myxococcota bacterium]|nr:hypothetical protein [Myxococcota bacterium]
MSLADALEQAATELPSYEDAIRDANGDPERLLETLGADGAGSVLVWLLENTLDAGEELAIAWTETEVGAVSLQAVEVPALKKPARKVMRKALHRLRSRGVEVEVGDEAPVVAHVGAVEDSFDRALLSPLDPRGARMAYLVEPHPAGGARMYEAVIDDTRGIVDFRVYSAGRSKVRSFLKDIAARASTPMLDVESDELRAVIARAVAKQAKDNPVPRAFVEHRSQLKLDPAAMTPGDRANGHFGEIEATPEGLESLAERVRLGAVGPWPPDFELLRELADDVKRHVDEIGDEAVLSGEKQDPKTRDVLEKAAAGLYDGDFGAVTAERLRETAFVLWQREKEEDARLCLMGARVFASGDSRENPAAVAFVEVLVAPFLAQAAADEAESEELSEDGDETEGDL